MPSTDRPESDPATIECAGPEEPDPPSVRPPGAPPALALVATPVFATHAAGERLEFDIAATISPLHAALALGAAAVAAFGTIAAASLIGYSPTRLEQMLDEARRPDAQRITDELDRRDRDYFVVATALMAVGWVTGLWALGHAVDAGAYPWALGIWIALMLFAAGSLPGAIADLRPERGVLASLRSLRAAWYLLRWPIVLPLRSATNLLVRALRLQPKQTDDPAEVQKQVMAAVADNVDETELADAERTWIGNIVTLKDLQVSTVMTPRPDIIALSDAISLREAVDQALEHEFSRYPVYHERIDDVVGVFYVKDALRQLQQNPTDLAETSLRTLLRDPLFVPETTGAAQLLRRMQAGNQHMAIVIDEYGTTVGLATVEDLLEEIVGEIEDEYDPPSSELAEEQVRIVEAGRVLEVPARTTVQDINRLLGTQLSNDGDWETVAGMVIATCNRIPMVGETVVVGDVEFRVLEANERRVQRLRVTALSELPQHAEESR